MEEKDIVPEKTVNEIIETIESLNMDFDNPSLIMDNKLIFFYEGKMYRVSMPTHYDRSVAEEKKNELYIRLLQTGKYLTRKQLRDLLINKQGIDIEGLEKKQQDLSNELKKLNLLLAPKLSSEKEKIEELKEKIDKIKVDYMKVSLELYNYTSKSIEDQIETKYIEYLTSRLSEYKEVNDSDPSSNEGWKKVWNTFEDFQNEKSNIDELCVKAMGDLLITMR